MKIVIGCLNSKYIHASLAPWCLKAGVDKFCKTYVESKVLESTVNGDVIAFSDNILKENPRVVSFSCYIWNITKTLEACKYIKENSNAIIVLGGPEVSYRADKVLKEYDFIDYVLCGEGEFSYPALIDTIALNGDLSEINGLCYRVDEDVFINPEAECKGTPPSPYSEEFYTNLNGRIAYLETSRGCPYRCAFCLSGRCSKLRFFEIEQVKNDIFS